MVGEALGTKGRNTIESSSIKGREITMNMGDRGIERRVRKKLRTKEQKKTKW